MLFYKDCGARQNCDVFNLYPNPDRYNRIFNCLLTSMAAEQVEDERKSLMSVGDLTGHHKEWLGSTTRNRYCVAAFEFSTVSRYLTDLWTSRWLHVHDQYGLLFCAPIRNSAVISMVQDVQNLRVNGKVYLKHQINFNTVCGEIQDLPWRNIGLQTVLAAEVSRSMCAPWLDVMYTNKCNTGAQQR